MSRRQALLSVLCLFAFLMPAGGRAAGRESLSKAALVVEDSRALAGFPSMTPSWFIESVQQGSEYGFAVSSAGDVNGDGYGDVLVGSSKYADDIYREGVVFVFHGSIAALSLSADWKACSGQKGSLFGSAVAAAGDVNGDGYADILVGAPSYNDGVTKTGAAFAYYGSPFGLNAAPYWSWIGGSPNADFGYAVASAGDVNQDGFADVLIGAPWFTQDLKEEGAAFLFLGSSTGLSRAPDWIAEGDQIGSGFGAAVSGAGDVNGDGFSDVIVGAPSYDNSLGEGGRVFLFLGSRTGLSPNPAWVVESNQLGAEWGAAVSGPGDLNADGFDDVLIGAPAYDTTQPDVGMVFAFFGSANGLAHSLGWQAESYQMGSRFGSSVNGAGDFNHDGYADIVVGASHFTNEHQFEGGAFVFLGGPGGLSARPAKQAFGEKADASFAYSVAGAGDVNGDRYSDLIVGSPDYRSGDVIVGRVFAYHGREISLPTEFLVHIPLMLRFEP